MFVSDLRQVGGFPRALRFPPPIKLTNIVESGIKHHQTNKQLILHLKWDFLDIRMKTLANKYSQLIGSFLMELLSLLILNVPLMSIKKQLLIHFALV